MANTIKTRRIFTSNFNIYDSGLGQSLIISPSGDLKKLLAGTNITLTDNGSNITIDASGGTSITIVNNFSALPDPTTVSGQFYWCKNAQGTAWLPGSVGGTYYSAGEYYSDGSNWIYTGLPYNASQGTVDTGTNADQFITPLTFTNASKWSTKENTLTFSTGFTRSINTITNNLSTGISGGQSVIGGTAVGDSLIYKGTTANGTTTVSAHTFNVGNNGATTALQIFNSGNVNIGNASNTNASILRVGAGTAIIDIGNVTSTTDQAFIHFNQAAPSASNYAIQGTSTQTNVNASSSIALRIANIIKWQTTSSLQTFSVAAASGNIAQYVINGASSTSSTASTETIGLNLNFAQNIQHATGGIALNRDILIQARTHSAVAASTITDSATLALTGSPGSNTNVTITNSHGLLIQSSNIQTAGTVTNSYGITVNAMTGGTNNHAGQFLGGTVILAAGTTGYGPIKFLSGTNLTTAIAGTLEYNGTNFFATRTGTTRETLWSGNDGAAAPTTNNIGVILDYYGTSSTRVLTTTNSWASVVIGGTTYKIPLYT